MKKFLILFMVAILTFTLVACGTNNNNDEIENSTISSVVKDTEQEDLKVPEATENTSEPESQKETVEWKEFLEEYEEIVDDYVEVYNKYMENPTDMTILNDYTKLSQDISEWSSKASKVETDLSSNPQALKEYTETLARITQKLSSIYQ